jgi:hypothetical protein
MADAVRPRLVASAMAASICATLASRSATMCACRSIVASIPAACISTADSSVTPRQAVLNSVCVGRSRGVCRD